MQLWRCPFGLQLVLLAGWLSSAAGDVDGELICTMRAPVRDYKFNAPNYNKYARRNNKITIEIKDMQVNVKKNVSNDPDLISSI